VNSENERMSNETVQYIMTYCARNVLEGLRTITKMSELKYPDVRVVSLIVPNKDAGCLGKTRAFG
jgi:hypothetical protein